MSPNKASALKSFREEHKWFLSNGGELKIGDSFPLDKSDSSELCTKLGVDNWLARFS